jgi:hypothetical protein
VQNGEKAIEIVAESVYGVSPHVPSCRAKEIATVLREPSSWHVLDTQRTNEWGEPYVLVPLTMHEEAQAEAARLNAEAGGESS